MPYYPGLTPLRDVLADLYPAASIARVVVAEAGIAEQLIDFDGSALELWKSILTVAQNRGQVQDLIDVGHSHFPENPRLLEAERIFHETPVPPAPAGDEMETTQSSNTPSSGDTTTISVGGDNHGPIAGRDMVTKNVSGINIEGSDVGVGGDMFVGSKQITESQLDSDALAAAFAPLLQVIQNAPAETQAIATTKAQALQREVTKQKEADDEVIGGLIQDLVDLIPSAVSAIGMMFGQPLLAKLVGPATKFVLKRIGAA